MLCGFVAVCVPAGQLFGWLTLDTHHTPTARKVQGGFLTA